MITRWDPFADISRLQDEVFGIRRANRPETFAPLVDIFEEKDAIYVKAELPGVKLEDIHVNLDEHVLTLTGERKFEKTTPRTTYTALSVATEASNELSRCQMLCRSQRSTHRWNTVYLL